MSTLTIAQDDNQKHSLFAESFFDASQFLINSSPLPNLCYKTKLGALFDGDCLDILPAFRDEIIDTIFADPPFNLNKVYGAKTKDNRPENEYIKWCHRWIDECIRLLRPGGAFFLYNLPRWNILLGAYLMDKGLEFRHDISIEMKSGLPISGKLYPAHYSLLYFTKENRGFQEN